jgi:hypothetical protein
MAKSDGVLWLLWAALLATLAAWLAMPRLGLHRADPWDAAETAVAGFVLAIFALVVGFGTLAVRESLVFRGVRDGRIDPTTPDGLYQLRLRFFALWLLCALVGAFGAVMEYGSGRPAIGWPYLAGSAALFALHAPRAAFLRRAFDPSQRG